MSFYRPITSALEATGCLGSLVNSLIGTRNSLKCIVEDGEAAFIQDVNLLLQHLHIEHPVGQYVANACHSYSQRIGTGTKTLLMFISLLTKAAAGLQYQGVPLSVSLPILQTCLDACVEHLKELLIPIRFKFHPQKTESSREGHRQEITCSEPCSQKEQVLFPEKDWSMDEDIFDIENYYFKTDTQRVDSVRKICSCFERKSDCDKCLKLSSEEDNNCIFMSTGTVLDRKTNGNHDKHQFIDIETSYDKTSEYSDISDFFVNIPVEPTKQEMKGLDKFWSQPEDKGNMEDQDEPIIQLQMRGIPANVNDDDDISWFFESGGVESVQESNTEKAFLQNLLKTHFSISHCDIIDKVEKRGDGIGKANVSKKNIKDVTVTSGSAGTSSRDDTRFSDRVTRYKRNSDSRDSDSEFEQCFDDMLLARREIVDPLNSFDKNKEIDRCSATLEKAGDLDSEFEQCVDDMLLARREIVDPLNGCSATLEKAGDLDSEFEQCFDDTLLARKEIVDPLDSFDRNKEVDGCSASLEKAGDLDSEFEQCFDDMLSARKEIVDPQNSFDRNKEIDGCSATLEKAGDLYHLQIDKKKENIDFKEIVVHTNQSIQMCKTQRCFGAEKKSAVFDGHNIFDSDKPTYLIGHTLDDISHKHEDEFDVCFEFDQAHFPSTMPVSHSKDPLALSVSEDNASFNFEDKILPGKIKESLKGVQAMLDELKVMPKGGISKHDSKGHVSLSRLQNSSRHFKTVDSSLKTKKTQIYSDKLSVQTKTNLECSKCTHLDTCTTKSLGCYDSNSNDFGNSGPEMILFESFESSGNNRLETDFSQPIRCFKTSDDKNIQRTKPKHVDHKAEEKSHQRQEFTISKAIGKNRDKITSDICLVSEVGFLQEFKNQINTENTPSGLEGNKSILFDSKMNNKENDGEVKNVEFVNERDHSSLRLISQKKVKISANARIDSLLQEGENNACGERFESESYLTETLFPAVHSLVSRLGHTNDKDIIEVISRAIVHQSTLPTDSITSRFDVKKVYCHTMQNSLKQTTALVDGLLLGVSTDQMILISQIRNKPCRALMVNGTVSPTFQHIGHKTSMQGPVITHTTETTPTNQWLQDVRDTLQQLRIDVILSKGPVCEEVILLALELHLVVIENVPYKALQALSVATEKEMAVYVDMAAEVNVCQVNSLSPWRSDWMDYGKAMVDSHYIIISVDRNILQTAVISQPCQGLADIKEQEFWQCASRVASSLHFGCVIPGGGRAEEHAMKFCQEQSDNTRVLNEEKSLFQSVIWEVMAIAFNEFVSTVKMNSQQSTFNEQVPKEDIVSGSLLESDAFDNQNPEVLDDYASKIAAWQTALEIASNILQLDMYIVTGITGMTKSNLVVL